MSFTLDAMLDIQTEEFIQGVNSLYPCCLVYALDYLVQAIS